MKIFKIFLLVLLLASLSVSVQAFTLNTYKVTVEENGDCISEFDYSMSFFELIGYYTNIASAPAIIRDEIDARTSPRCSDSPRRTRPPIERTRLYRSRFG